MNHVTDPPAYDKSPNAAKEAQDLMHEAENTGARSGCCCRPPAGETPSVSTEEGSIFISGDMFSAEGMIASILDPSLFLGESQYLRVDLPAKLPGTDVVIPQVFHVTRGKALVTLGLDGEVWVVGNIRHEAVNGEYYDGESSLPPFYRDVRRAKFTSVTDAIRLASRYLDCLDEWHAAQTESKGAVADALADLIDLQT